ncbi:MAG: glycosyltransferase family 4 protein [Ignavibacteriales bacterium]|nr:glycosyltransferase family 4 protein [Ignavibacteriales bacterium]
MKKLVCFFSNEPKELLLQEQYSLQDINILNDLGFEVVIANSFKSIPLKCDLYFSWWASGSILPLIKAKFSVKPIIVVAGGNEVMFYKDSFYNEYAGYLATPYYKKIATKITLRFSTKLLVVSNFMLNDVKKIGAKSPIVVYNSVDTIKFKPSLAEKMFITIIMRLEKNTVRLKRGHNFIKAIPQILKNYPEQQFLVIGEKGNAYEELKKLSIDLGISRNIKFLGSVNNSEIVEWLQKTKVYVQISDTETFGVAIAEAMSCGVPVVVSNRGAIPEIVGKLGIFVDHNDPLSISRGILSTLNQPQDKINESSQAVRTRMIENFSYEKRKQQIENIIENIVP